MNSLTWKNTKVSLDGTHHIIDGAPLYERRFLSVMSFHEPGLAAVRDVNFSLHINVDGSPAYSNVFEKTFGFYEELAAVQDKNRWFHITSDGIAAYDNTYDWCGNFQHGFAVVRANGRYCHIAHDGCAISEHWFLYAGDFKESRAVVRLPDGLCAHINELGDFAHAFRYQNLGVYHKGYACACDNDGWMHINRDGIPIYKRRFLSLEPFYNECALAETFEGGIVIIDEQGENIGVITNKEHCQENNYARERKDYFHILSADMVGYWKTHVLAAAVKLSAPEKFPILEHKVGEVLKIPEDNAQVFMHALAELGIIQKHGDMWKLTAKGEFLRDDHPFSLAAAACYWSELAEVSSDQWLQALIKKTKNDVFAKISNNPQKIKTMHEMLAAYAKHDYANLPEVLPLEEISRLIDVGGGNGTTARLIASANKNITVVVFDRPEVLSLLNNIDTKMPRVTSHGGDVFLPWDIDGDAVLLARVLHDWDDEKALLILRNAHNILTPGGKIFIVELLPQNKPDAGVCSFHLLTVGGGRERMLDEYKRMMSSAGFMFLDSYPLGDGIFVITGEAI